MCRAVLSPHTKGPTMQRPSHWLLFATVILALTSVFDLMHGEFMKALYCAGMAMGFGVMSHDLSQKGK